MMENKTNKDTAKRISFAAVHQYIESNIIEPTEIEARGGDMIQWGVKNNYPNYISGLYHNVPTLQSVINGVVNYVSGNSITTSVKMLQEMDEDDLTDLVEETAKSLAMYGGFAWQIIRTKDKSGIAEIHPLNMDWLRSDKENEKFFYSEKFGSAKYVRNDKVVIYPKFMKEGDHKSSILFVKNGEFSTYPIPLYGAAVKACETEKCVDDFHLNAINNGFTGSYIINFNCGNVMTPDEMEEVEKDFNEKFSGHPNAGRIGFCWNNNKASATTIEKIDVEDFGVKYESLAKRSRQEIFTAFRANPNLFGIPTENLGFSKEEYESAFKLFNKTIVIPMQKKIIRAFNKVFDTKNSITIVPFSLEDGKVKEEE